MTKYVYVQRMGTDLLEGLTRLRADRIEQIDEMLVVKNGKLVVATFDVKSVQGWWILEEKE